MATEPGVVPTVIVDRLRANLRGAGIPATEADIEAQIERGYLRSVAAFESLMAGVPPETLPDYLGDVGPAVELRGTQQPDHAASQGVFPAYRRPHGLFPEGGPTFPSLAAVAGELAARRVSPVELTRQALEAIERYDPQLNTFQVVLAERALAAARRAEEEIGAGAYRGPLHGVPVAAKDLLAMAGTVTTAGSRIRAGQRTEYDAAGVALLESAGAVIVGKTRLSEFAYSPGSTNAHYGPTRNPWRLEHDTGGSSSGSGAALAAGLVYGALGTDTGGSIRIPGSQCGLVGLKPTFGRVSLYGAATLSWSQDHLGPMARCVADTSLLLDVLAGYDPRDRRSRPGPPLPGQGTTGAAAATAYLEAGVRGLRIGVLGDDGSGGPLGTPEALAAWQAGLHALEREGATLVPLDLPDLEALRIVNSAILVLEAAAYHQPMLRTRLDDFGPFMRHRILHAYGYGPTALTQAQQARALLRQRTYGIFETVDLLSTPTMPAGAPLLDTPASTAFTRPFNALGWPALTVPVGLTAEGLPLGLQLVGRPWDETTVLLAARAVERSGPWKDLA